MFYFQSRSQEMFVYQRVCEEYLYTSAVRRGCVQGPDTNCTDDRRTQQCSNSATVLSTVG